MDRGVGLLGSAFVSTSIHARPSDMCLRPRFGCGFAHGGARAPLEAHAIPKWFTDYGEPLPKWTSWF